MSKTVALPPELIEMLQRANSDTQSDEDIQEAADARKRAKIPHDIMAAELLIMGRDWIRGNPFKPGDLVTPRAGHNIRGHGKPMVVLEVFPPGSLTDASSSEREYSGNFVRRPNMRVLTIADGHFVPFLAESFAYEPYTGEVASLD